MAEKNVGRIIKKGFYNHTQEFKCMQLKQYIITEKGGKKCLLFRFFNESELLIDSMEFTLMQFDSDHQLIDSSVVKMDKIQVESGGTYTPDKGLVISDACVDFIVNMTKVSCGEYVYSANNGGKMPRYCPKERKKRIAEDIGRNAVRIKKLLSCRLSAVIAAVLVIAFILLSVYLATDHMYQLLYLE